MKYTRRQFLQQAAAASIAAGTLQVHSQEVFHKYRTALIGCGWWGKNILREAIASKKVRITALCDVDRTHAESARKMVQEQTGDLPNLYEDYRELLDRERPEIAIVATPDHWHPLITIHAVQAGAHVYVEKPISHTIIEGQAMVQAARKYGRIVQVDLHRRVSPHNISAIQFLRSGKAGKIGYVRAFVCYGGARGPEQPAPNEEPPKGLNWDLWCGPAPLRPFNRKIHPKGFRQFLDYANGTLGDWGVHWIDQILWWAGEVLPRRIYSTGGRPIKGLPVNLPDAQTTDAPDSQVAVYEFDSFTVEWEHRLYAGNPNEKGENVGVYFYGTKGVFHIGWRTGWTFYPASKSQSVIHQPAQLHQPDNQNIRELWADFLDAIQNNRLPVCDIEVGYRATLLCLLGMLSLKIGRSIEWDAERGRIAGDEYANLFLRREYRPGYQYPDPDLV